MQILTHTLLYLTPRTRVFVADILYFESSRNYTYLYLINGRKILLSKTLGGILQCIPTNLFIRISRTHAVNSSYLNFISRANEIPVAHLNTGALLPVSRRRLKEINLQ